MGTGEGEVVDVAAEEGGVVVELFVDEGVCVGARGEEGAVCDGG